LNAKNGEGPLSKQNFSVKRLIPIARRPSTAFVHDLLMIPVAWVGAYWLRFNLESLPEGYLRQALLLLPIVIAAQGSMFWYFGLYRGVWRFASIPDLVRIFKAVIAGLLVAATVAFLVNRLQGVPRSVFILDGILLLLLLGGPRFAYRWFKDRHLYTNDGKRALIVGAGMAGETLMREMLRDASSLYRPVALVDDDPKKMGKDIHGLPVVGKCDDIAVAVVQYEIDLIVIAMPTATTREIRRVVEICEKTGCPFRTLPRLQDIVSGRISMRDLRDVHIEDLLGREPITLDWQSITLGCRQKVIMVTGGGGSIGAELCRQIARLEPKQLIIFERSEYNLFAIEQELKDKAPGFRVTAVLGDVADVPVFDKVCRDYRPQIVFHAAAYKHVPMLEQQVRQAVVNNVIGTHVVAQTADRYGCETVVLISTDKAVNPSNVMGATKRLAEMVCEGWSRRSRTRFVTVRFGNVLGSSGSVVPLFREQIARGGPVTVTHPDVTRYFMTIPEACQLILQASVIAERGEIFLLEMGEPVKISYLAEQLILLSGKKPGEDIEIRYTGLRPGEKMFEELYHGAEKLAPTTHPKILRVQSRPGDAKRFEESFPRLQTACGEIDEATLRAILLELVPELGAGAMEPNAEDRRGAVVYPLKTKS
jgi:FlaA1/EpsC-like NDP-sugar epimerase